MLAASRRSVGGGGSKFLITSFTQDRPGLLLALLDRLGKPLRLPGMPVIEGFSVDSSMSASLVRVGAMALVVEPVVGESDDVTVLDEAGDEIRDYLLDELKDVQGNDADRLRMRRVGFPPVKRVSAGDELSLYGGRVYREVRFGLRSGRDRRADVSRSAAEQCARILTSFTASLKAYEIPIAFVHFPHGWRSHHPDISWLRVAYAVDQGVGSDIAAEVAAWNVADRERVALSVYEPTNRDREYPYRYEHILRPPDQSGSSQPQYMDGRVSICVEGLARTGLLSDTISALSELGESSGGPLALFGCTAGVLYGHTVTNLVVDADHGAELWDDPGKLRVITGSGDPAAVSVQKPDDEAPVMEDKSDATFWIAWCCGESSGVIRKLLRSIFRRFRDSGAAVPNVEYAISRVVADGFTCAGKIKLSGDPRVVDQLGLHDQAEDAKAKAQDELASAISDALERWHPAEQAWKDRPIWLTSSEPREEPWATLVVPEGAAEGLS